MESPVLSEEFHNESYQPCIVSRGDDLEPEIHAKLFDPILTDDTFELWKHKGTEWHLRCYGAPGSGKVCKLEPQLKPSISVSTLLTKGA